MNKWKTFALCAACLATLSFAMPDDDEMTALTPFIMAKLEEMSGGCSHDCCSCHGCGGHDHDECGCGCEEE